MIEKEEEFLSEYESFLYDLIVIVDAEVFVLMKRVKLSSSNNS